MKSAPSDRPHASGAETISLSDLPPEPAAVRVLGVRVHALSVAELHARMDGIIREGRKALVLHANVHGLNLAARHPWMRDFLNQAEIVFCDGAGVRLGARVLGQRLPPRITYADWIWQLAGFLARERHAIFLLGARPGVAARAAAALQGRHPRLRVAGTHHGYFEKEPGSPENEEVIARINAARPEVLLVGFGMPLQERWLRDNWPALNVNVGLSGGAALDYAAGDLARAPRWMTDRGLEWLGRLLIEPRRLGRRYLIGNPAFLLRVLAQRVGLRRV